MGANHGISLPERSQRARQIEYVLWLTLFLNWGIALFKLVFGYLTHCIVIVADGFHSLSDGSSNIVGIAGIRAAARPDDPTHPYGHWKYETLAAIILSFFLFAASFSIIREAWNSFRHPRQPEVTSWSFGVMALTLAVNIFTAWYERKRGRELRSELLLSDAWHTITDIFVSLAVFAALAGILLHIPWVDSVFSVLIAALIAYAAFGILKHNAGVLCDRVAVDSKVIEALVRKIAGVEDCHEIRTRGRTGDIYIDLHVLVDPAMSVELAHGLSNVIERDIRAGIEGVTDVIVHIEPTTHTHEELKES